MPTVEEDLVLDITQALRGVDRIEAALLGAASAFSTKLEKELARTSALELNIDGTDLRRKVERAFNGLDPIKIQADADQVTREINRAVARSDTNFDLKLDGEAITRALNAAIARATNKIKVDVDVNDSGTARAGDGLRRIKDEADGANKSSGFLAGGLGGVAAKAAPIAAVGASLVGVGIKLKDAVDLASDLQEATSKSQVVFEDLSSEVEAWARTTVNSAGLSSRASLEAAGSFGALFKSMGIANRQSTDFSTGLVQLAADMASFSNTSIEDALVALKSGLIGEAEPLRRFGVLLSEERVQAEALGSGLVKLSVNQTAVNTATINVEKAQRTAAETIKKFGIESIQAQEALNKVKVAEEAVTKATGGAKVELTDQQKVQARYQLILKDTALAQGDFARTSDGVANSQRILAARIEENKVALGTKLLPAYAAVLQFSIKALESIGTVGTRLQEFTQPLVDGVQRALTLLRSGDFSTLASEIRRGAESGLGSLSESFSAGLDIVRAKIVEFGVNAGKALSNAGPIVGEAASRFGHFLADNLGTIIDFVIEKLPSKLLTLVPGIGTVLGVVVSLLGPQLLEAGQSIVGGLSEGIRAATPGVADGFGAISGAVQLQVGRLVENVQTEIDKLPGRLQSGLDIGGQLLTKIGEQVDAGLDIGNRILTKIADSVRDAIPSVVPALRSAVEDLFNRAVDGLDVAAPAVQAKATEIAGSVGQAFADVGPTIPEKAGSILQSYSEWVNNTLLPDLALINTGLIDPAARWVLDTADTVRDNLETIGIKIASWVVDETVALPGRVLPLVSGLLSWIGSAVAQAPAALLNLSTAVVFWILETAAALPGQVALLIPKLVGWAFDAAIEILPGLANIAGVILGWIARQVIELPDKVAEIKRAFLQFLVDAIIEAPKKFDEFSQSMLQFFKELPGKLIEESKKLDDILVQTGRNVIEGLFQGMLATIEGGGNLLTKIKDALLEGFKKAFEIGSPAKVTRPIGRDVARGIVVGMENEGGAVVRAAEEIARQAAAIRVAPPAITAANSNPVLDPRITAGTLGNTNNNQMVAQFSVQVEVAAGATPEEMREAGEEFGAGAASQLSALRAGVFGA